MRSAWVSLAAALLLSGTVSSVHAADAPASSTTAPAPVRSGSILSTDVPPVLRHPPGAAPSGPTPANPAVSATGPHPFSMQYDAAPTRVAPGGASGPQPSINLVAFSDGKDTGSPELQVLQLNATGCDFKDTVQDSSGRQRTTQYHCYVTTGGPVTQERPGRFSIAFRLPEGVVTTSFNNQGTSVTPGPQDPAAPVPLLKSFSFRDTVPSLSEAAAYTAAPQAVTPAVPKLLIMRGIGDAGRYTFDVQYLLIDSDTCALYDNFFDAVGGKSGSTEYPCRLLANSRAGGPGVPGGSKEPLPSGREIFTFAITWPTQTATYVCQLMSGEYDCGTASVPGARLLMGPFRALRGDGHPPALSVDVLDQRYRPDFPRAAVTGASSASAAVPAYHITVAGFSCKLEERGKGAFACSVEGWSAEYLSLMVDGALLQQPAPFVYVSALLKSGAWYLVYPPLKPYTPLMLAAAHDDQALVQRLLAEGADVNAHDPSLDPPAALALRDKHMDLARFLITHGADVNAKTKDGSTVFLMAFNGAFLDAADLPAWIDFCAAHGADVNQRDRGGATPLMHATLAGQVDVVKALLDHGADPKLVDTASEPAMMFDLRGLTAYQMAAKFVEFARLHGVTDNIAGARVQDLKAVMALLAEHGGRS